MQMRRGRSRRGGDLARRTHGRLDGMALQVTAIPDVPLRQDRAHSLKLLRRGQHLQADTTTLRVRSRLPMFKKLPGSPKDPP